MSQLSDRWSAPREAGGAPGKEAPERPGRARGMRHGRRWFCLPTCVLAAHPGEPGWGDLPRGRHRSSRRGGSLPPVQGRASTGLWPRNRVVRVRSGQGGTGALAALGRRLEQLRQQGTAGPGRRAIALGGHLLPWRLPCDWGKQHAPSARPRSGRIGTPRQDGMIFPKRCRRRSTQGSSVGKWSGKFPQWGSSFPDHFPTRSA